MNRVASKLPTAARLVLGLVFVVFGANGFLQFLPMPPPPASAVPFLTGIMSTHYFFPLLKGLEVTAGLLLLSNRFVPLALAVLAPIIVNITAFHLFVAPGNYPIVALVLGTELYLAWVYRSRYAPMLAARNAVVVEAASERVLRAA